MMMTPTLTVVFISLLVITTLTKIWLGNRHISFMQAHRQAVPKVFDQNITLEDHQKAADYSSAKTKLGLIEGLVQAVLLLLLTIGGGLQLIDSAWRMAVPEQEVLRGAFVILSALFISSLVELPFDYYK